MMQRINNMAPSLFSFLTPNHFLLGLMMIVALFLSACDVHQFPEQKFDDDTEFPGKPDDPSTPEDPEEPEEPEDPDTFVDLDLALVHDTDVFVWEHYYDPKLGGVVETNPDSNFDGNHPGTTDKYTGELTDGYKYATVKISKKGNTGSFLRHEEFIHALGDGYNQVLPIRIAPGEYDVIVWSDLTRNENQSRFYDVANFHSVKINYDNYEANTDYRDTFRGRVSVNLGEEGDRAIVPMKRPMAKYEFITTDLSEFLDNETRRLNLPTRANIEDYDVKIYYSTYHPSAYNVVEDWLTDSSTGVSFNTEVSITGESEASLGYDYVFLNDTQSGGVQATIVVYDKQGNNVAQSVQITVPLRRDHHTVLRGAFLTMNGSGGVGIDPGYNGDHNVFPGMR